MNAPLVYVIVINWNGLDHLEACFSTLLASSHTHARFLLVDNASTDGSCAFVRQHFGDDPRVEILALPENRGWSGGNNAGMDHARANGAAYVFLLNNDTATDSEAVAHLVARMEADPALGALAPRMVLFDQPEIINSTGLLLSTIGAAWDRGIGRIDTPDWHHPGAVAGVCGGAMFLRASALEYTGLLPEEFEIYLDDLDLCLRLWHAGYTVDGCPEAIVRHKFSATMGAGKRARHKYYLNTRNRFRILLRHFPVSAAFDVLPRVALGEARAIGRGLLSGAPWRVLAHLRAWGAALAYLPEARKFRREHAIAGLPRFWPLVISRPSFCPALQFPQDGWYPAQSHGDLAVRPMARRAWLEVPRGTLQVLLVNCYPAGGDTRISLHLDETPLGVLHTPDTEEATFEVDAGRLTIVAESVFLLEDRGGEFDVGAWLRVTANGTPLT